MPIGGVEPPSLENGRLKSVTSLFNYPVHATRSVKG